MATCVGSPGEEFFVDASGGCGYLTRPGDEQQGAHPIGPGDGATPIRCGAGLFADRFDGPPLSRRFTATGTADVGHHALLAEARHGADASELGKRPHRLLNDVTGYTGHWHADTGSRPGACPRTPGCSAMHPAPSWPAERPARVSPWKNRPVRPESPHHPSRAFRSVTGTTLTYHGNDLRIRGVLHTLEEGEESVRSRAYAYGCADQAHPTRVFRSHTGKAPSALRVVLAHRA
ncbi:helix-turn-helix domain-containing protein [Streptomyces sp. NPDC058486]|uniref:helix-turn-helix domain-containing protein n=1 Tax=unclassified Streptomyces TaxID=2593676 RepID=UPI0036520EA4